MNTRHAAVALLSMICSSMPAMAQDAVAGDRYRDAIPDWEIVKSTMAFCKVERFDEFFANFAENPSVQMAFTDFEVSIGSFAPEIIAAHGKAPEDLSLRLAEGKKVEKSAYQGQFRIAVRDYYNVDAQSLSADGDYKHLDVHIKQISSTAYRVDWSGGEFSNDPDGGDSVELIRKTGNPGAYIFEFKKGCWHLTQDMR